MTTDTVHDPRAGALVGRVGTKTIRQPHPAGRPIEVVERYVAHVRGVARAQQARARRSPDAENAPNSKA
jgi:hypothetical protein